jgi:DNA mismatch repair protein PMS2
MENGQYEDTIVALFGSRQLQSLQSIDWKMDQENGMLQSVLFRGFLSKPSEGRSLADRQYIFVNRRPCDIPKVNE